MEGCIITCIAFCNGKCHLTDAHVDGSACGSGSYLTANDDDDDAITSLHASLDNNVERRCDALTTAFFISEVIAISDSITAPDTQLTRVAEAESTARVARTVAFIAQVRTVKRAVTSTSHVNTPTTSTAKLLLIACCT